jgi:hypothetical protein
MDATLQVSHHMSGFNSEQKQGESQHREHDLSSQLFLLLSGKKKNFPEHFTITLENSFFLFFFFFTIYQRSKVVNMAIIRSTAWESETLFSQPL